MLSALILVLSLPYVTIAQGAQPWPCPTPKSDAEKAFKEKILVTPMPQYAADPYSNQTSQSKLLIANTLANRSIVCAFQYIDERRGQYELKQFGSKAEAENQGFTLTHQGRCGSCSTFQDLAIYLSKPDLTKPVRNCALKSILSSKWAQRCLEKVGFSPSCAQIWMYNVQNTRKNCLEVCLKIWVERKPNNNPDGSLNACLQCDENKSGPVFKYFAGRTRRDSGIESAIKRPGGQVYNMTHCYY